MIGASRDRRTRNVAPTALSQRADAEQRAGQPRPSLAEIKGVTGEDDKHEVEGTDQHVLATGDRQHLRRAGSFTHGAQAAARQTQRADTRRGPVVGRRRVDADMRQSDEKAGQRERGAGSEHERRTIEGEEDRRHKRSAEHAHALAVPDPQVRDSELARCPDDRRDEHRARRTDERDRSDPDGARADNDGDGSRHERGSRGTTEHDSLRGVRSQAHTVWPATMGDRRGQRCDGDDRDQQHDRRQARRRWAVSLEHVHQGPDEQSPLGQDVGEVGDDEENKVAVPQGSAHRTP